MYELSSGANLCIVLVISATSIHCTLCQVSLANYFSTHTNTHALHFVSKLTRPVTLQLLL
jgi:ABC-type enterochelin transport system permease subunit